LSVGVLAGPRAADARGDLFPISHILGRIVSADDRYGQETPDHPPSAIWRYATLFPVFD
jgi:hypothetical protein